MTDAADESAFLLRIARGQPGTELAWTAATLPPDDWARLQHHVGIGFVEIAPNADGSPPCIHVVPFSRSLQLLLDAGDIETTNAAIQRLREDEAQR